MSYRKLFLDFRNGSSVDLTDHDLVNIRIKRVYTLLDENLILTENLNEVLLKHLDNVFMEDKYHDWNQHGDKFHFYGHSGHSGEIHNLIIEYVTN
jgi:hypothetical protein